MHNLHLFNIYNLVSFDIYLYVCVFMYIYVHISMKLLPQFRLQTYPHTPKVSCHSFAIPPFHPSPPFSLFCHYRLSSFFIISYKWNQIVCPLFCLASFTHMIILLLGPINSAFPLLGVSIVCIHRNLFPILLVSISGVLATIAKSSVNIHVQIFVWIYSLTSWVNI